MNPYNLKQSMHELYGGNSISLSGVEQIVEEKAYSKTTKNQIMKQIE